MSLPIVIANYLPQFHPTKENDEWWGKGFTEWTNVSKARPLFRGHYQPRIPADLGFYDLRYEDIRDQQAIMAEEAGVTAFCYWHYWFGGGRRLLNFPFDEVVRTGKPDFPFCLGWANHDWQKKDWSSDVSIVVKETLVKQEYGGVEDYRQHFYQMLSAFRDDRYLTIDGRLVFLVFRPDSIPDTETFFNTWNRLAEQNNLPGFFFIACSVEKESITAFLEMGYDKVNLSMLNYPFGIKYTKVNILKRLILSKVFRRLSVVDYATAINVFDDDLNYDENVVPTIIPNWDHSPRSAEFGHILHNSTPELFGRHVTQILDSVKDKKLKIVVLKSWNEWGEGNYMEPDLRYGKKYIYTLRRCIEDCADGK